MTDLLESLNPVQRQAVQHGDGPLLLLSGAGSGKTRVITHRIAYLLRHHRVSPSNILAVTFTNKAAREMKSRLEELIGEDNSKPIWMSTFHAACVRILRRDIERLGFSRSFTIYDTVDQLAVIKEILKDLQMREEMNNPKAVLNQISKAKNNIVTPKEFMETAEGYFEENIAKVYPEYQSYLHENNALDFDDLIGLTVRLFNSCSDVLEYYRSKFRYILVDEYQDTNRGQYLLVHALTMQHQNICAVGDDDQSIYSWRGADLNNILDFEKDFPGTKVLRLEQNYRSTQKILAAAYEVVRRNHGRKDKNLWTANGEGDAITCYRATDEIDEANYVVRQIQRWRERGLKYGDCVIFYRTNAQSGTFEDALRKSQIPYQVLGGVRFFERMEIKDLIAYLRVGVNQADKISLRRIINVPRRGIGKTTIEKIDDFANVLGISLFGALQRVGEISHLREATKEKVRGFLQLIESFDPTYPPAATIKNLLDLSDYLTFLNRKDSLEERSRVETVKAFVAAAARYEKNETEPTLLGFLELITLATDVDSMDDESDVVTLMTLHGAKGLEFPIVFMAGVEDGYLPHQRAIGSAAELEEERRLCYVGLTRAKTQAYLTHAQSRTNLYGETEPRQPSIFIDEIPWKLLKNEEAFEPSHRPVVRSFDPDEADFDMDSSFAYKVGESVFHPKLGRGKITGISGSGSNMRITIRFVRGGEKTLIAEHARLQPMVM